MSDDAEQDFSQAEPEAQQSRDAVLQQIVNDLAETGKGRPVPTLAEELRAALEGAGVGHMPETWIDAVAQAAGGGNPYVVSAYTAEHVRRPEPKSTETSFGTS
jgi:hypothetical protein